MSSSADRLVKQKAPKLMSSASASRICFAADGVFPLTIHRLSRGGNGHDNHCLLMWHSSRWFPTEGALHVWFQTLPTLAPNFIGRTIGSQGNFIPHSFEEETFG